MSRRSTRYLKAALTALHYSGAGELLAPLTGGVGAIFMLHQVGPDAPAPFSPNRILKITPDFLAATLEQLDDAGFEFLSLDAVAQRLAAPKQSDRPFAAFTLDDAYRDNFVHAAPVFRRFGVPYTIYAPTDYIDGHGDLWWLSLEQAIARLETVECRIDDETLTLRSQSVAEKDLAYHTLYWRLRKIDETVARSIVAALCERAGVDVTGMCRELVLDWDELRTLAADPLATIGAHTRRHFALSKLGRNAARYEMAESVKRLEAELGRPVRHFSYPFGDEASAGEREFDIAREIGVASAVTTRKGLIHAHHAAELTALPRLSLNGDYQDPRYTKALLSGAPFALYDLARRVVG